MMSLYAPEAVFIAKDGRTITDHTEIAAQLERPDEHTIDRIDSNKGYYKDNCRWVDWPTQMRFNMRKHK